MLWVWAPEAPTAPGLSAGRVGRRRRGVGATQLWRRSRRPEWEAPCNCTVGLRIQVPLCQSRRPKLAAPLQSLQVCTGVGEGTSWQQVWATQRWSRGWGAAQWHGVCLVCASPWVPSPALQKKKKKISRTEGSCSPALTAQGLALTDPGTTRDALLPCARALPKAGISPSTSATTRDGGGGAGCSGPSPTSPWEARNSLGGARLGAGGPDQGSLRPITCAAIGSPRSEGPGTMVGGVRRCTRLDQTPHPH